MKTLRRTKFGNPVLRQVARRLSKAEIRSDEIQALIVNMRHTVETKKYGVGLAAPQVGESVAISAIAIKPTPSRPDNPTVNMVIINPEVVKTYGRKSPLWEGCMSFVSGSDIPYALVPRYKKIRLSYDDETGRHHEADFEGITAHVMQHETDHLNGMLFVDRVEDTTSYTTISEYMKRFRDSR